MAYRPNQTMNFYVDPADGHDDYVISLALAVDAARDLDPRPRVARGRMQPLAAPQLSNRSTEGGRKCQQSPQSKCRER